MCIQVSVRLPRGGEQLLKVCDFKEELRHITVLDLKKKINQEMKTDDDLRIVFKSKTLEDVATLDSSQIQHMSTIHTVPRLPGGTC